MPSDVERVALVADPFGTELKRRALIATLHDEFMAPRGVPEFAIEAVVHRGRRGHPCREISFRFSHRAYLRRIRSLTGATIGPDTTIEISASLTWHVDVPRTWRAASIISSSPCM